MKNNAFISWGKLSHEMFVIPLNGRKNITDKIVESMIKADINAAIKIGRLKVDKEAAWNIIANDGLAMKYYRNGIQKGTYEKRHIVFCEEVQKELGKVEEDYWSLITDTSCGSYDLSEVVIIKD